MTFPCLKFYTQILSLSRISMNTRHRFKCYCRHIDYELLSRLHISHNIPHLFSDIHAYIRIYYFHPKHKVFRCCKNCKLLDHFTCMHLHSFCHRYRNHLRYTMVVCIYIFCLCLLCTDRNIVNNKNSQGNSHNDS